MEEGEGMKKFCGILAFLSFFYVLGIVGGMENDLIGLGEGFVRAMIALVLMALFARFAGAYDYADTEKEDRQQERHSYRR